MCSNREKGERLATEERKKVFSKRWAEKEKGINLRTMRTWDERSKKKGYEKQRKEVLPVQKEKSIKPKDKW